MDTASSRNCWTERQVTNRPQGHMLTNTRCWSPDSRWLVYDVRRKEDVFDGPRIERVNVETGEVEVLYEATRGAHCGVVTYSPVEDRVVFIHGPENPTFDWHYVAYHRRGAMVDCAAPGKVVTLDARDLTEPITAGALRGGTHVHVFSGDGRWVSFTYEDHLLAQHESETAEHEMNLRNVGVSVPAGPAEVAADHPRNHSGAHFSVLVSATVAEPMPGSDEISRAFSDAWVGTNGYLKPDGARQEKALAFQGHVRTAGGETISEVFVVDLPGDLIRPGLGGPLQGTLTTRPRPPAGVHQRRLTYTADRKHPGLQGPRHWLRSSPDGAQIAFLMKDDKGIVQLWTVSPNGGPPRQATRNRWDVASAFSWSPDGRHVAYLMDNSVFTTEVATGRSERLTPRADAGTAPTHHACVFSPDGRKIAYLRPLPFDGEVYSQIMLTERP